MTSRSLLTQLPAHSDLQAMAGTMASTSIAALYDSDPERAQNFTAEAAGLRLDYSKHLLDNSARHALLNLAQQADLATLTRGLMAGEPINNTENRPALHTLLRASSPGGLDDKFADVVATRARMRDWSVRLNQGQHFGYSDQVITDIVNIGIGGSDLGPRLVTEALRPFQGNLAVHYVANVDPADIQDTLLSLNPETTLFIVCSKSFRTEETLTNSLTARAWMINSGANETDLDRHFLAITTNLQAAADFGIPAANCLPIWDWVGGRYSVWSAVGLSCAIAIGWEQFEQFLAGARAMDQHFLNSEHSANLPVLMSLLEVWYCNYFGARNHVVLPYDNSLQRLPDFLQQLTMESNGKQVSAAGEPLPYTTGPVLWGSAGTMGQHSFHQLLHQGTTLCPADFILPLKTHTGMSSQHRQLVANGLAQSRTMMVGRSAEDAIQALLQRGLAEHEAQHLAPHLAMPGNRPNSVISMESVNPGTLGALLALYEHRTFCSGMLWGINPFDQWGVELGKEIGMEILGRMAGEKSGPMDPSTDRLMALWQAAN